MIDLKGNPFYLSDAQADWVNETLASMTEDEKIGQLFCPISYSSDEGYLRGALLRHRIGGLLFKTAPSSEVRGALDFCQRNSQIPLLCAAMVLMCPSRRNFPKRCALWAWICPREY